MRKLLKMALPVVGGLILLIIGSGTGLKAQNAQGGNNDNQGGDNNNQGRPYYAPEIDLANGIAAAVLVAGVVLIIRGRRKTVTH